MKKVTIFLFAVLFGFFAMAQSPSLKINDPYKKSTPSKPDMKGKTEEEKVLWVVEELFNAMNDASSQRAQVLFAKDAKLVSTSVDANGKPAISEVPIPDFIKNIGQLEAGSVEEKIFNTEVRVSDNLATVWTDYNLYVKGQFSHCGVDAFQLFNGASGWQIIHVSDTRKKDGCNEEMKSPIDQLLDDWHQAAAVADENRFFNAFAEDGVFMGTDATENWNKGTFKSKTAKSFNNSSAWNFKPVSRTVTKYDDGKLAWFEETLDTWMGPCRGSGVLALTENGWKIKQYNLAALVPNDKMDEYRKLIAK